MKTSKNYYGKCKHNSGIASLHGAKNEFCIRTLVQQKEKEVSAIKYHKSCSNQVGDKTTRLFYSMIEQHINGYESEPAAI